MARNNPKPSGKINWQAIGEIIVPSPARKLAGWLFNIKPPAQSFNWFWNLTGLQQFYSNAQVEDWIVIDSDADEGDYATLVAYIADAPAAGDRILVKEDQTVTAQFVLPANVTLKFLDGSRLLCATNIATSVLKLGSNLIIEGVLNIVLSHTGTTAKAVEYDGDNAVGKINIENASTGTLTTGHHINANKTGNRVEGFIDNTGGGVLTNEYVDNSTEDSNILEIRSGITNQIARSDGAKSFRDGLEFDLVPDADGDIYYRDAGILKRLPKGLEGDSLFLDSGIPEWRSLDWGFASQIGNDLNIAGITFPALTAMNSTDVALFDDTTNELKFVRFNGTNWTQVGNALVIATVSSPAITALSPTNIAFIDSTNEDLRNYGFDGADWTQVGNDLNISGISSPAITALSPTNIAFIDSTNEDLRNYGFDGADWTQVGNDLNISGIGIPALTGLSGSDIVFIDSTNQDLRIFRFDNTDWAQEGNDLNISGVTFPSIAALIGGDIAFIDATNQDLRLYRWNFSFNKPYRP